MSKQPLNNLQARAVRLAVAAETHPDPAAQAVIGAESHQLQLRASRVASRLLQPVLDLPENATKQEVTTARRRQAVRRGDAVFLPLGNAADTIPMPNVFVRGGLFAAGNTKPGELEAIETAARKGMVAEFPEVEVPGPGEGFALAVAGPKLGDYDRKVFAACLAAYEHQPLARENSALGTFSSTIQMTYYAFAQAMDLKPGGGVYAAIRDSLLRLNAATLRIRFGRKDYPLPRLVNVAFDDGLRHGGLQAGDKIAFCVVETIASLFGVNAWSAVHQSALKKTGLAGWLASFYATHREASDLSIAKLHQYSGVNCELPEFRRMLNKALTSLKKATIPERIRVAAFTQTRDTVTVELVRWQATKATKAA